MCWTGTALLVGVEIGSLQVSKDFGESFVELPVDPDPQECDIHRILVHPDKPNRIIIANGIVGMMVSEDGGTTWQNIVMPPRANYPDAVVIHPDHPDLLFVPNGQRADTDGQVFESLDGSDTWTIIADVPPVSKADFYKGLIRDRVKLANVNDIVANPTALQRWAEAGKRL